MDRANALRDTDGQFVNSCSDALARPTPDRVRELVVAWGKQYPLFGRTSALELVNCLQWPSGSKPNPPQDLKINVLILGGQHDPISGSEGVSATAAVIINAKAASKRVMWQGIGHGAIVYTPCAQPLPWRTWVTASSRTPTRSARPSRTCGGLSGRSGTVPAWCQSMH